MLFIMVLGKTMLQTALYVPHQHVCIHGAHLISIEIIL